MKNKEMAAVAEDVDLFSLINSAAAAAEKVTHLSQVYLARDSFATAATPTGSLELDRILGGGVPPGRMLGISGPEAIGKSLIATQISVEQLKAGRTVCYMDAEGANDPLFLKARGIDFDVYRGKRDKNGKLKPKERDSIFYYQPETGDQVMHYLHGIMSKMPENRHAGAPPIVFLLDSVVALVSDAISEDIDSNKTAMHAKMYSEFLPIIIPFLARTGCSFVYTNQLRSKPMVQFGPSEYEPCGSALQFFSSVRIRLSSSKPKLGSNNDKPHPFIDGFVEGATPRQGGVWEEPHYNDRGEVEGLDRYMYTAARTNKNKCYTPHRVTWIRIHFDEAGGTGRGLDPVFDLFTFLQNLGLLKAEKDEKKKPYYQLTSDPYGLVAVGVPEKIYYQEFKKLVMADPTIIARVRQKAMIEGDCLSGPPSEATATAPTLEAEQETP